MSSWIARTTGAALGVAALAALAAQPARAADDIVFGASIPMTGVFAFAGTEFQVGFTDYVTWINAKGGINGRKLRYVMEDTGYKVDVSVAAFKKIMDAEKPPLYFGDSTGFMKAIKQELGARNTTLMSGASFASELTDPKEFPNSFIAGPSYAQMMYVLLEHINREKPGAKLALVHSDTEFGRDPIADTVAKAKALKLDLVETIVTKPGSVDVSGEVSKLRRRNPDYIIFHGYVLAPINEFMEQIRALGMTSKFMGTFWSSDRLIIEKVGKAADGYLAVMPYAYFDDETAKGALMDAIREITRKNLPADKQYRTTMYQYAWFTAALWTEVIKRTLDAGKPLNADTLRATLNGMKDWDSGGLIGVPVTIAKNSIPVGRIYRADVAKGKYVPVSDYIKVD